MLGTREIEETVIVLRAMVHSESGELRGAICVCVCVYQWHVPLLSVLRYYKKFSIPDMQRCCLQLEQDAVTVAHANNTLIITVSQPAWTVCCTAHFKVLVP